MSGTVNGRVTCNLSLPDECRAWCALAEIGLCVLEGGFGAEPWATGVESEVEEALGKALPLAQRHPSLASYSSHLIRLSARAAPVRARQLLRPALSTLGKSFAVGNAGGSAAYYYTQLAWADHLVQRMLDPVPSPPNPALISSSSLIASKLKTTAATAINCTTLTGDLAALRATLSPLLSAAHANVVLLARVIELRALFALSRWTEIGAALERAESAAGIILAPSATVSDTALPLYTTSPFHAALVVHVLILGVVWFSYAAVTRPGQDTGAENMKVSSRFTLLYALLDAGVYNGKANGNMGLESEGVLAVPLDASVPPLYIRLTHPRVLNALAYLISAVARRNLLGPKPKRKIFVLEGLGVVEREAGRELRVPRWASAGDVRAVEVQMAKIKADLMCELISVSIMRSEFDDAERTLDAVIAHARTHGLFGGSLAHRITLLHAQLAHALGLPARAQTCYRVAVQLAREAGDVAGEVAARAGEVALLLGLRARAQAGRREQLPLAEEGACADVDDAELARMGREVAGACMGLGGALRAVGEILEGVLASAIFKAQHHFKNALSYATEYQDNHLRALILALITPHYVHTARDSASKILATCEQLAAGPGEPGKKEMEGIDAVGNAPLRLWAAELRTCGKLQI
ncbi:hypothetical protein MVEN_01136100 [Mycena venus]|uniref:Uncharacterized protein n=1 Tax=Mycena venus TaxID=2733690 RepID=A0A8H6Y9W2_9AGAR|nr:hypothetical protein MVEN_01136100 [Mycena venus]